MFNVFFFVRVYLTRAKMEKINPDIIERSVQSAAA
jgi:hypothetical protein